MCVCEVEGRRWPLILLFLDIIVLYDTVGVLILLVWTIFYLKGDSWMNLPLAIVNVPVCMLTYQVSWKFDRAVLFEIHDLFQVLP